MVFQNIRFTSGAAFVIIVDGPPYTAGWMYCTVLKKLGNSIGGWWYLLRRLACGWFM